MRPTLEAPEPKIQWARKYAREIGVGLAILGIIFLAFAISSNSNPSLVPAPTQFPQYPNPQPTSTPSFQPTPTPEVRERSYSSEPSQPRIVATPTPVPVAQAIPQPTPAPTRIIAQPQITEIPFRSSTTLFSDGISASVVRLRTLNGQTAVTFKVDGSGNSRSDLFIRRPLSVSLGTGVPTYIIDNNGRRYRLIDDQPDVPEQIRDYNRVALYYLAPHEVVYLTYLLLAHSFSFFMFGSLYSHSRS